jgi:uncharacterized membrane protein
MEAFLALLFLLVVAGAVAVVLAVGHHTRRMAEFEHRLAHLERDLARLRLARPAAEPAEVRPAEEKVREAQAPPAAEPEVLMAIPVRPVRAADADTVEGWIGRQGMGWAAVVLLLFATAFFLKYAFDNRWIGELGRVSLGVLAGAGL